MNKGHSITTNKKSTFWISSLIIVVVGIIFLVIQNSNSSLNILPILIEIKEHKKPKAVPGTFAEDYSDNASKSQLKFNNDSSFSFKYIKSERKGHAFTGCFFPLENVNIDFSRYDILEVGISTKFARRIPLNLSVQNNLETYQYIRHFIEIKDNQSLYVLKLKDFFTPSSWYDRNNVAQVDIPEPDMKSIGAMSFESCHLLNKGVEDEFTINKLILKKDIRLLVIITLLVIIFLITLLAIFLLGFLKNKKEVIHIPIVHNELEQENNITNDIMVYLAKNYTNPNLTLATLTKEFGKSNSEISTIIKEHSTLTFPKYLNYLRLEEAKRLLKLANYKTVSEVGYTVGFNSPSNFIRVFKRQEGTSPKKFAEEISKNKYY